MSDGNWYVVRTTPRAEYMAVHELERDGFEVYFPRLKSALPRPSHEDTPLFPSYLFLRCDPAIQGWPSFRPAHRVSGWLRLGDEIPSVPDEVIEGLMQGLDSINGEGGFWRRFKPGEKVHVVTKSIESLAEVLEESRSPHSRVKVLLEFMGRMVPAQIPWENLRPIEELPITQHPPRRTRGGNRWIQGFGARAAVQG